MKIKKVSRDTIVHIPVNDIRPNPDQPRERLGDLSGLIASIKTHGVQQPVTVSESPEGFTLIAGHRRLEASKQAGLTTIPAIVRDGDPAVLALVENIQRTDLSPLEEAAGIQKLLDRDMTQQQVADLLGVGRSYVAQKVRLLDLPPEAKTAMRVRGVSEAAARQILRLNLFDKIATAPPPIQDTWANHRTHNILWGPCYFTTVADVQFAVDEELADLALMHGDYANLSPAEAESRAKPWLDDTVAYYKTHGRLTFWHTGAILCRDMRPDWSKLTDHDHRELVTASQRFLDEYDRRHPAPLDEATN